MIITELAELIDRQAQEIHALADILEQERSALANREAAVLERLSADKLARLAAVDRIEHQCCEWLTAAGFSADGDGIAHALRQSEDSDLGQRWQALQSQLALLRRHNERNGLAIRRSLTLVEEELVLLRGGSTGMETYDADGRRAGDGRSRPLTRA